MSKTPWTGYAIMIGTNHCEQSDLSIGSVRLQWWTREAQMVTSSGFIDGFHVLRNAVLPFCHINEELFKPSRCLYHEVLAIIWCAYLKRVLCASWNEHRFAASDG